VGINKTRSGIIDVFLDAKANIEILDKKLVSNEEVADIRIRYSEDLEPVEIKGEMIPRLIDELPVLAVLMSQAKGLSRVFNAEDLRNKESDRIKAVVEELSKIGVKIKETADGFTVEGKTKLKGGCGLETYHDHRLAMSFFVAGLIANEPFSINGFNWVETSFPNFLQLMCDVGYN
jgi:3-phosphoshikimate 1-carboxyvinyltransferase